MRAFSKSGSNGGESTAITRTAFTTSRLLEFCSVAELTKLASFEPAEWPSVVVKEH